MASRDIMKKKRTAAGQNVRDRDYWLDKLSGEWVKSTFPHDHQKGDVLDSTKFLSFQFQDDSFSGLMRLSNESDYRLFMILTAQLVLLLYKYTGSKDIIVGAPILKQDIEGDFINTVLALRNTFEPGITFKELLLQVRQTLMEAVEHQNYPIEVLLDKLNLEDSGDGFPLFDMAILLENIHDREYIRHIDTDMVFIFRQTNRAVKGLLEYNPLHYTTSFVEGIISHYTYLIRHMMTALDTSLRNIEILSEDEKKQLLVDFNDTEGEYPEGKTIHQLFEEQVEKTPGNVAIHMTPITHMTYDELNKKSNQLVYLLIEKGVEPDTIVVIMVERSIEMIIGILGILKAGGAYLPIDPHYPESRIRYMLEDSGAKILITTHGLSEGIVFEKEMIYIEDYKDKKAPHHSLFIEPTHRSDSLVYLIYTSGSTGRPKGVMLEHKNVVNLIHFDFNHTNLDFSRILQFHTIGFDASFHEIFCALLSGGTLYLIEEEVRADIPALFDLVERNGIVTLFLPMSYLRLIFNEESFVRMVPRCVKHIQTAGEQVVINNRFRRFLQENHVYLHNHYGPAETHVVTTLTLDPEGDIPELPSIGKPILNTRIYILDKEKQLVPLGVPGELYIGGIQVGRGYLKKPKLTADKFDQDFQDFKDDQDDKQNAEGFHHSSFFTHHSALYRTGDLARWMRDGNIEFLGRVDKQVKIRGFRVEPGEIESRLTDIDHIKEAIVIDRTDERGDKFLCAYVVSDIETNVSELREILTETLPDYMVPSYFIQLEEIPLTPNGKVDWRTLQAIEIVEEKQAYAAPRNEVEKELCGLWSEILGLEKKTIGIDDNFFQLGGHSLKAVILISKLHKEFNVQLSLADVFDVSTIRGLAEVLKGAVPGPYVPIKPAKKRAYYRLSSAQQRLFVIQQMDPDSISYNLSAAVWLKGDIDKETLEETFKKLIHRHESLRTSFEIVNSQPMQRIHEKKEFKVEYFDLTAKTREDTRRKERNHHSSFIIHHFITPFDLSRAPLLRVGLIKVEEKKHILMLDMHHIITDGTSVNLFIKEFTAFYEGIPLPPVPLQYKDFSEWQNNLFDSGEIRNQEAHWIKEFEGGIPLLNLPTDYPRPASRTFEGGFVKQVLDKTTAEALKKQALEQGVTLSMLLFAIYNILLSKLSGQEDIVVGVTVSGRRHADLEGVIGMFINILAVRNFPRGEQSFIDFLKEVKKRTLDAFENQDYPFEKLVERAAVKRNPGRNPLFDVEFVMQVEHKALAGIPETVIPGLKLKPYELDKKMSNFDLFLFVVELEEGIVLNLQYWTKLFKEESVARFLDHYARITQQVINDPEITISDIEWVDEAEKNKMLSIIQKNVEAVDIDFEF